MNFGSLFAGIGGMDLGLERSGMRCAWQVEIDDYATRVLEKHWPTVQRFRDIHDVGRHNLSKVDLICGGFPCQPVSCAGQRGGDTDSRWLWPQFRRVLSELKPRWVFIENVPGLLSLGMGSVISDLSPLGYVSEWGVLSAEALGAPYERARVWIVAHLDDKRKHDGAVDAEMEGMRPTAENAEPKSKRRRKGKSKPSSGRPAEFDEHSQQASNTQGTRLQNGVESKEPQDDDERKCGMAQPGSERRDSTWWTVEPDVVRMVSGVPKRVDRIRCLGNAVIPQWAEFIGQNILRSYRGQP